MCPRSPLPDNVLRRVQECKKVKVNQHIMSVEVKHVEHVPDLQWSPHGRQCVTSCQTALLPGNGVSHVLNVLSCVLLLDVLSHVLHVVSHVFYVSHVLPVCFLANISTVWCSMCMNYHTTSSKWQIYAGHMADNNALTRKSREVGILWHEKRVKLYLVNAHKGKQ